MCVCVCVCVYASARARRAMARRGAMLVSSSHPSVLPSYFSPPSLLCFHPAPALSAALPPAQMMAGHERTHEHAHGHDSGGGDIKDLWSLIEESSVECLNQDAGHRVEHCFKQGPRDDDAVFLASDCDEQLLINLKFKQSVRLHSVAIKALDADKAPKKLKFFVNPVNMSFDSAVRSQCFAIAGNCWECC